MDLALLLIVLLNATTYCFGHSIDTNKDYVNDVYPSNTLKMYHIRRLLHREKRSNNQRLDEMKNEISNNENDEYDRFQRAMDQERGEHREEYRQKSENEDQDITVVDETENEANEDANINSEQHHTHHLRERKRIYEYKWKHDIPHALDKLYEKYEKEKEEKYIEGADNDGVQPQNEDATIVASDAVHHPVLIKTHDMNPAFGSESTQSNNWSKMTFWLLMSILFINAFAILYCIYGRQMMSYLNTKRQTNFIAPIKKLSDEEDDDYKSDTTDDEENI